MSVGGCQCIAGRFAEHARTPIEVERFDGLNIGRSNEGIIHMAIIIRVDDLTIVPAHGRRPRGVTTKNRELLNALVQDSKGTVRFMREEIDSPVYLNDVEIRDDGAIVVRSEALCQQLEAAQAAAPTAAAKPNCICGKGC